MELLPCGDNGAYAVEKKLDVAVGINTRSFDPMMIPSGTVLVCWYSVMKTIQYRTVRLTVDQEILSR